MLPCHFHPHSSRHTRVTGQCPGPQEQGLAWARHCSSPAQVPGSPGSVGCLFSRGREMTVSSPGKRPRDRLIVPRWGASSGWCGCDLSLRRGASGDAAGTGQRCCSAAPDLGRVQQAALAPCPVRPASCCVLGASESTVTSFPVNTATEEVLGFSLWLPLPWFYSLQSVTEATRVGALCAGARPGGSCLARSPLSRPEHSWGSPKQPKIKEKE